jgi:hypothetical protein
VDDLLKPVALNLTFASPEAQQVILDQAPQLFEGQYDVNSSTFTLYTLNGKPRQLTLHRFKRIGNAVNSFNPNEIYFPEGAISDHKEMQNWLAERRQIPFPYDFQLVNESLISHYRRTQKGFSRIQTLRYSNFKRRILGGRNTEYALFFTGPEAHKSFSEFFSGSLRGAPNPISIVTAQGTYKQYPIIFK